MGKRRRKGMRGAALVLAWTLTAGLCACGEADAGQQERADAQGTWAEEKDPGRGNAEPESPGRESMEKEDTGQPHGGWQEAGQTGPGQPDAGEADGERNDTAQNGAARTETEAAESEEAMERISYLQNPISGVREDTWYDYGTGDPFVMRYNGAYYLYMSTRDTESGVKCFRSRDLVNWSYQGLCCTEEITKGAYAPEVVYYNGSFYMYTSPAGKGHYVLKSDSPTGPFLTDSDNFGLSIDGSVFIDDDGKWYFLHAGDNCILANDMTAPNEVSPISKSTNTSMGGWTEGAMMIKHDGRYYMTYTGNHVFSKGYRINYAVGDSFGGIAPSPDNPALIHTLGETYGIGHSSTVKGPDLDSYYIVYHTLTGRAREGMPKREMNVDRIVFNGDRMDILGPTVTEQQLPDFPEIYAWFEQGEDLAGWEIRGEGAVTEDAGTGGALRLTAGSRILSKVSLGDEFTAEYNLRSPAGSGRIGGYFHYMDEDNYGAFEIDLGSGEVRAVTVEAGKAARQEMTLPESFGEPADFGVNQTFQVEKKDGIYTLYFQEKAIGTFRCGLEAGAFGYFAEGCEAVFGYIGASGVAGGDSACTYEKPLPGEVQGIHASAVSGQALSVEGTAGSQSLFLGAEGSYGEYVVRVEEDGLYNFSMLYAARADAAYGIYLDGVSLLTGSGLEGADPLQNGAGAVLNGTAPVQGTEGDYRTTRLQGLKLEKGTHTLRLEAKQGALAISCFAFSPYERVEALLAEYETLADEALLYSDGTWRVQDGLLKLTDPARPVGKRLYGSENYGDYIAEADITPLDEDVDVGILIRTRNPAKGGAGDDAVKGTYFAQGYYAGMTRGGLCLLKLNYGREELARVPMEFAMNETYHMKVEAEGSVIRVYLGGELCLEYEDQDRPFLYGSAGVRGFLCNADIDNFRIEGLGDE
ncbi:MAG: family 43 glycosylhydrolase [Lachnospiraceae bacterium]|nr:family 43 glycosylhydrolase [Lachnospiraceae bacterium]